MVWSDGDAVGQVRHDETTHDQAAFESDARVERMDRVAVLFSEITSATRAFLAALAESDRHRDWADEGFASCAEWLAWQLGINRNTANEKVRAARALERLPLISEAMSRGEISFTKVRALTRAATPDNEAELLEFAQAGSAANLERIVRGWKQLSRGDELQQDQIRHRSRYLTVVPDDNGMYIVRGRLTAEVGAALMRAVDAGSDALFKREKHMAEEMETDAGQRRADAVGLLAERALSAGLGAGLSAGLGAGLGAGSHDEIPISGSRADRYQVVLHVEASTLTEAEEPGQSELEDGTRVSAETARRLACDAGRVEIRHASNGSVLDVGRKTRTVPPALRRALESRDRGCRFPGCGLRFTDAHHIQHWGDGGETKLTNLVLLCRRHHRRVHEGGYRVFSDVGGQIVFFTPAGRAFAEVPQRPERESEQEPDPSQPLIRRNRRRGVTLNERGAAPRFRLDRDIPWPIEAAAWDALERTAGDEVGGAA
jgi:Domain of unknown function (DUF222)/HNH endonuclease